MKKVCFRVYLLLIATVFLLACEEDEITPTVDTNTYEGLMEVNPANFPGGAGLDLSVGDTGSIAQLDATPNFEWDIKVMTYRTSQGGRPAVYLFGDNTMQNAVKALNISTFANLGLGEQGFNAFDQVSTEMQNALQADGVFNFDPAVDLDEKGQADAQKLSDAYQALQIGDKVVRLNPNEQPVFLVQDRSGALYKFQYVQLEGGGKVTLRWARFAESSIE